MKIITRPLMTALLPVLFASSLAAQTVPAAINYQGRLTDNGTPPAALNATVGMQFEIWDGPGGTSSRLWRYPDADATGVPTQVVNGIFSISLGGGATPLPPSLFASGAERYLQIIVNPGPGQEVLAPRQRFTSSGFSARAENANDAANLGGVPAAGYQPLLSAFDCPAGEFVVQVREGGTFTCAKETLGVSSVTPSGGITASISGGDLSIGTDSTIQRRTASAACAPGNYMDAVNADGSPSCRPDVSGVTAVSATQGLSGSIVGNTLNVSTDATVQRRNVAPTCPAGQYLQTIAANGTPTCVADAGVSVPMSLSGNLATPIFSAVNNGAGEGVLAQSVSGYAIRGTTNDAVGGYAAVTGNNAALGSSGMLGGSALLGPTPTPIGAYGGASSGWGIYASTSTGRAVNANAAGTSGTNYGVYAATASAAGYGVFASHGPSGNFGSVGNSTAGVSGSSPAGVGVYGSSNGSGAYGVHGSAPNGTGVRGNSLGGFGVNGLATSGTGVRGDASTGYGVNGVATSGQGVRGEADGGIGVQGASNTGVAVRGDTGSGTAVLGYSNSNSGIGVAGSTLGGGTGVSGSASSGDGVRGVSVSGRGVYGQTTGASGTDYGVQGEAASTTGRGVFGYASATTGATNGVVGQVESDAGAGVRAIGSSTDNGYALQIENGRVRALGAGVNTHTFAFIHSTVDANSNGKTTCINNSMLNGHPEAIVIVTPVRTYPSGTITYNFPWSIEYHGVTGDWTDSKWCIFRQDGNLVPDGMPTGHRWHVLAFFP